VRLNPDDVLGLNAMTGYLLQHGPGQQPGGGGWRQSVLLLLVL
jgi:hypothetical protein